MTRIWKDVAALGVTVLAVLTYFAASEGWNVWLVGDNPRWAAAAIFGLGVVGCNLGSPAERAKRGAAPFAVLGSVALVLAIIGVVTGSLTAIGLLTAVLAVMWALATLRHVHAAEPIAH